VLVAGANGAGSVVIRIQDGQAQTNQVVPGQPEPSEHLSRISEHKASEYGVEPPPVERGMSQLFVVPASERADFAFEVRSITRKCFLF